MFWDVVKASDQHCAAASYQFVTRAAKVSYRNLAWMALGSLRADSSHWENSKKALLIKHCVLHRRKAAVSPMCMMPRRGGFADQTLTTALISPKNSNILFEDKKGYSMALEYRSEMTLRVRLLLLLAVPFVALIGSVLISFFGVFSREAYELVASIFGGDMTRLGDFLGYILVMAFSVGVSSTLIIACLFTALVKQNYVVEIDADRRIVDVHFLRALPWQRYSRSSYQFDEIEAIELKYDVEETEILLRLPNRKRALRFTSEFKRSAAESKLRQFKEMGLPVK